MNAFIILMMFSVITLDLFFFIHSYRQLTINVITDIIALAVVINVKLLSSFMGIASINVTTAIIIAVVNVIVAIITITGIGTIIIMTLLSLFSRIHNLIIIISITIRILYNCNHNIYIYYLHSRHDYQSFLYYINYHYHCI